MATPPKKHCRRCHKLRAIHHKGHKWCRSCTEKVNRRYYITKILPYPEKYEDIFTLVKGGILTQRQIAGEVGRSVTGTQSIIARYTTKVDEQGKEKPR